MIIDPDKKVEKIKKERPGLYQSTKQPYHFDNEGSEFSEIIPDNRYYFGREEEEEFQSVKSKENKSEI